MDERGFRRAASVLSREHGIRVLRYMSSGDWRIASEVSRALDVHTSTVSNLLAPMFELGFLQRRVRSSQTRSTFEYRMPGTRVAIEIEFSSPKEPLDEEIAYSIACIENVFRAVDRLGWPGLSERMERSVGTSRDRLDPDLSARLRKEGSRGFKSAFAGIQRELLSVVAEVIGRGAAVRIFESAATAARQDREKVAGRTRLQPKPGATS